MCLNILLIDTIHIPVAYRDIAISWLAIFSLKYQVSIL